jgi:hypothetical protein
MKIIECNSIVANLRAALTAQIAITNPAEIHRYNTNKQKHSIKRKIKATHITRKCNK